MASTYACSDKSINKIYIQPKNENLQNLNKRIESVVPKKKKKNKKNTKKEQIIEITFKVIEVQIL